jgi:multiple sugar transport system substrate-binding protein
MESNMNKKIGNFSRRDFLKAMGALSAGLAANPLLSNSIRTMAQDVMSQPTITILINDSPWFPGFAAMVELYSETTGNQINLDVTPFPGMLDKTRNAVQAGESEYDAVAITEQNIPFFYSSGTLKPILDIDADYALDDNIISYGDAARWDSNLGVNGPEGTILGVPINGNIQLYYYRRDLFDEAGIEPPKTFDEMEAIAEQLGNPPRMFGNANRANPIWWEFGAYVDSYDAEYVRLEADGSWSVGFERPEGLEAVQRWLKLGRTWAPQNYANLGQGDLLALMASGRLAQVHMVGAAAPNYDNPEISIVGGKMGATVVPGVTAEARSPRTGMWVMCHPDNLPAERAAAGLEFVKWLTTKDNQFAYAKAGAIPVRQDTYEELATDEVVGWWTSAFAESTSFLHPETRLPETPLIRESVSTRLAQTYVDEISAEEAVALMASEIRTVMEDAGYTVS